MGSYFSEDHPFIQFTVSFSFDEGLLNTLNGREVKQTIEFCWIYCFYIIIQLQFIEIHSDQECLHAC